MSLNLSPSEIFVFLFVMLGPLKLIVPYVRLTAPADEALRRELAFRAFFFSLVALLVAGVLGQRQLVKFHITPPAIELAAGLTLAVVAFRNVLEQYSHHGSEPAHAEVPTKQTALFPITFPMVVTPYGVATLIGLLALMPASQSVILGLTAIIMCLDLLAMLFAHQIIRWMIMPLAIIGSVLGIIQLALGIQMCIFAIRSLVTPS